MFQILIMRRYYPINTFLAVLSQHRLGYRTADLRFGSRPEFINQQQRAVVGLPHHLLHIHQV